MAVRWKQNTETMILQATIWARVSVTLNQTGYDEIADETFKLREQREKCTVDTARDAQIARINELQDFHQAACPHTWKPSTRPW